MNVSVRHNEKEFHDEWASSIAPGDVAVISSWEGASSPECKWIYGRLGDLRGLSVLELGSGAGEGAVYFALKGAKVVATDLSPGMLKVVGKVADLHGVTVDTVVASADDLSQFEDESFDIVYGANLLHHVDIATCLDEVKRVLKPNGRAAFWDPVQHNPAINLYRRMAAAVRTPDEHPIRMSDMKLFSDRFVDVERKFFWFTALLIFLRFYLIDRIHPSADRYWKLLLTRENEIRGFISPLLRLDGILLKTFPILGWWCWNIAIIVRK